MKITKCRICNQSITVDPRTRATLDAGIVWLVAGEGAVKSFHANGRVIWGRIAKEAEDHSIPVRLPHGCPQSRVMDKLESQTAAKSVVKKAEHQRRLCLAVVQRSPGLTAPEIAVRAKIDRYDASRRLPEVRKKGLVANGAARKCTENGTMMATWLPVDGAGQSAMF